MILLLFYHCGLKLLQSKRHFRFEMKVKKKKKIYYHVLKGFPPHYKVHNTR